MELNTIKIGEFIHRCRKARDLTQAELGERLSVSSQSVSHWERGETLPDVAILPDLAVILRCTVDAILLGGEGVTSCRRHVTVGQMREVLDAISRIGMLLGHDHFVYRTVVDALNARMNTDIEPAFTDAHLQEVFTVEFLLACVANGDYVDPRDVTAHLRESRARAILLNALWEKGFR